MIGQTLAHYRIAAAIGAGGMGEVYRATDTKLGRDVALKVLPAEMAASPERLERFRREAKALAALDHPGVVGVYSVEEADGVHFLTMQLVEGESLDRRIPEGGLPVDRILGIASALAEALAAAHEKGVVHRDLKPANVMVTKDGRVKVLDFGLAKVAGSGDTAPGGSELPTEMRTREGVVMGTVPYMSPEQVSDREVDQRTDLFSLGIILYEMASGRRPFQGSSSAELASAILRDTPRPLGELRGDLPAGLVEVIRRCLEKKPADRIATARDLRAALRGVPAKSSAVQTEVAPASRPAPAADSGATRAEEGFWVAVLPFKYTGAIEDLVALAEGLSEEIVTGLSRFSYLRVIARSSTARFGSGAVDVRAIGKEIGARYVMEGSLRQAGAQLRVAVQLVDANTGAHLWADTYNRPFRPDEIFDLHDELVPRIVSTVADWAGVLPRALSDAVRSKAVDALSPYEAVLRGCGYYQRVRPDEHAAVRQGLERAVEEAPRYADAWVMLSMICGEEHRFGFNVKPDPLGRALHAARRAVDAAPSNHLSHLALAQAHYFRKELDAFRNAAERAVALNPMDGFTVEYLGHLMAFSGDWERGLELGDRARQLNPHHPAWYWALPMLDAFRRGDYRGARALVPKAVMPGQYYALALFAAIYGQLGEREAAGEALRELLALKPDFAEIARDQFGTWYLPPLVEQLIDGLRKAGLAIPEPSPPDAPSIAAGPASSDGAAATRADEGFWVAVLPFKYTGANADLVALAEGLSEEIVTGLSRFSYLRVIARSSTARFATGTVDVRAIGTEIGARYVMEGSLRQAGAQLRVAVQLVDTASGAHLWAETYDRPFRPEEVFALQDELVPRIVSTLADMQGVLPRSMSDAVRSRPPEELSPYEAVLRGFGYPARGTPEELAAARSGLEAAVQRAPAHGDAWAMLAFLCVQEHAHGFGLRPDSLESGLTAARRAVEAAPSNHLAHCGLAQALFFHKERESFRIAAERAVALNPMDGLAIAFLGELLAYSGDLDRGLALAGRAKQLNAHHPGWYWYVDFYDAYRRRDYSGALGVALKVNMPNHWFAHASLAAAHGQLGQRAEAARAVRELLRVRPDFTATARKVSEMWWEPEHVEHMIDGWRKAGLEVEAAPTSSAAATGSHATSPLSGPARAPVSLAVLPFADMSADVDNEHFCEGLAEELLNALSKIDALKVAARASAFSFRGKAVDAGTIARTLGVTRLLDGSIRRSGNRLRISVQLVSAADGCQVWSERYDREMRDVFELQDEITLAVVAALKLKLFGEERAAVLKRYTENAEAYELFLKGRHHANTYTAQGWQRAIELFEKAIALQPDYAPALAGIAAARGCQWFFGLRPAEQVIPQCRADNARALAIDDGLADAYLSLGIITFFYDWDWRGAERAFLRAIELRPGNGEALAYYALFLAFEGRVDEAMAAGRKALALDPLAPLINMHVGWACFTAGQAAEAWQRAAKMIEIDPGFYGAYWLQGAIHLSAGEYAAAADRLRRAVSLGGHQVVVADLASACSLAGAIGEATAILDRSLDLRRREYLPAICLARIYSRIGDAATAIQWLDAAFAERNGEMVFLDQEIAGAAADDPLRRLAGEPRVRALLDSMRLPRPGSSDSGTGGGV